MGIISNDPFIAKLHAEIERNVLRILDEAIAEELRCTPPTVHVLVSTSLRRVRAAFADDIKARDL